MSPLFIIRIRISVVSLILAGAFVLLSAESKADYPGECSVVNIATFNTPTVAYCGFDTWSISATGTFTPEGYHCHDSPVSAYRPAVDVYYYEDRIWHLASSQRFNYFFGLGPYDHFGVSGIPSNWTTCADITPPPDCSDEYSAKVQECGGEQNIATWNDQTCTGTCKTCDERLNEKISECHGLENVIWDPTNCTGSCKNLGPPGCGGD